MPPASGTIIPAGAGGNGAPVQAPADQNPTPQFQITLGTTQGDFVIAASDTVNDLYDQAKNWMNISDEAARITDGQIRSCTLQEVDPNTGNYVDSKSYPCSDKKEVLAKVHLMGAR